MELLVCIKQVPDTSEIRLDPETNNLIRTGLPSIINPYDMHALEAALSVKDQYEGSRVTVITMGPPQAEAALRLRPVRSAAPIHWRRAIPLRWLSVTLKEI